MKVESSAAAHNAGIMIVNNVQKNDEEQNKESEKEKVDGVD